MTGFGLVEFSATRNRCCEVGGKRYARNLWGCLTGIRFPGAKLWDYNERWTLYKDGYEQEDVLRLLRFIDWVMILPEELAERFDQEHQRLEEEVRMRYVTTWERKAGATMLKRQLTHRFKELPTWVEQRLTEASQKDLEHWSVRVLEASRLEDVFAPA